MSAKDELFTALLEARNNSQERSAGTGKDVAAQELVDTTQEAGLQTGESEQDEQSFEMSR